MNDRHYAMNKNLWCPLLLIVVFSILSISCVLHHEWLWFCMFFSFTLLAIFVILIQPLIITFSKSEIQIVYTIGVKETIPIWKIREIYSKGSWFVGQSGWPVYVIAYPCSTKKLFFVNGELPKTKRIKKLLRAFYRKDFE